MKKTLLLLTMLLASLSSSAQLDSKSIGAHLSVGTRHGHIGFGLKGDYFVTDNIRLEAAFDNYFKKNKLGMWDLAMNGHYVINLGRRHAIYPIVGFTMTNWYEEKMKRVNETLQERYTEHSLRFGSNFGAGLEYGLTYNLRAYAEAKTQIVNDYNQWVVNLGLKYRF